MVFMITFTIISQLLNQFSNKKPKNSNTNSLSTKIDIKSNNNESEVNLMEISPYNDGYAWANFSTEDSKSYFGCIDKEGKIYSAYDTSSITHMSNFYNGVAGVYSKNCYNIIDIYGNIIHTEDFTGRSNAYT